MDARDADGLGAVRMRRRRRMALAVAVVAVLASAGGALLSTTIKSPAQVAAETKSPGLTRLTVPVQRRVISVSVLAQGVVAKPPEVSQSSTGAGSVGAQGGSQPVVTRIFRRPGSFLAPGQVILEVDGEPVFTFAGTVPAYRDMVPGDTGIDVAQLQAGLASVGYSVGGDTSGVFGAGTASAVAAYYRSIGYTAPTRAAGPKAHPEVMVPASELMFVPRFPARVEAIGAKVGHVATKALVVVSMGNPAIHGQLNPGDAGLVRPGMAVAITDPVTHRTITGRVRALSDRPRSKGSIIGGLYLPLSVQPDQPLPVSMVGRDVTLAIHAAGSGVPVLAVPEAAVFAHADGRVYVAKVTGSATQVDVAVRIGITGDGWIEVTPLGGAKLAPGDLVVTGVNYAGAGAGASRAGTGAPQPFRG